MPTQFGLTDRKAPVFSHPELNSLRFLAFLLVFVGHAPLLWPLPEIAQRACAFGVELFFLLSAYLIVSLLLREREQSGTVKLRFFAMRRLLRIWPLYFLALVVAYFIGKHDAGLALPRTLIASFTFLLGNVYVARHGWFESPIFVLWSLSIEEQFYLFVPLIVRTGGVMAVQWICYATILSSYAALFYLALHAAAPTAVYVNSFVQFQFFAVGGLIAAWNRKRMFRATLTVRALLLVAGLALAVAAAALRGVAIPPHRLLHLWSEYLCSLTGAALVFFAFFDYIAKKKSAIGYLGIISYGLYVFHTWVLKALNHILWPRMDSMNPATKVWTFDALALLTTVALAAISYRFFERPILRFKSRFEIARSDEAAGNLPRVG